MKYRKYYHIIFLALILFIAAYFRFSNFTHRISLGLDSTRDAYVALEGARTLQLPLVGPFTSIAPLTTGPYHWIEITLAKLILVTPYAPWLLMAIFSLLLVVVMYQIGVLLEGRHFGLIVALITALSPVQISEASGLTNNAAIGFHTGLVIIVYLYLLKFGPRPLLGFLFGTTLGVINNIHYQTSGLLVLPLTLLIFRKKYLKSLTFALAGYGLTFIPLLLFELTNHWYNTRHLLEYLRVGQYNIWVPFRWLTYVTDYWPRFMTFVLGGSQLFGAVMMVLIAAVFGYQMFRRKLPIQYVLLGVCFLVKVVIIRYYRGERFFGYLKSFHPFIFLFTAYVLYFIFTKKRRMLWGLSALVLYAALVLPTSFARLQPEALTTETYELLEMLTAKLGDGPFNLYECKNTVKNEIEALAMLLLIQGKYDSNGKNIAYHWGCNYPSILVNNQVITHELLKNPEEMFPKVNYAVEDFSIATPAAILSAGWTEVSPEAAYQSAARWWFDEHP